MIMQYFKGYKLKTLLGVLAKVLEAVFELLMPLIMVALIDQGILMNDYEVVFLSTLKMLGLTILGYATTLVCQYYAAVVSQNVGGRIRSRLFSHIMTFSLADTDVFSSATLTNRLTNDIYQIQTMINMVIRLAIRAPFLMIGSLIAMNSVSPILAMRLLLFFPLFVIVVVCFMFLSLRYYKQAQAGLDRLIRKVREMLSGVRVIRAFAKADYETKQFQKLNRDLQSQQRKAGFITALSSPTITLLMNMVLVYLVYLGALEINQGLMTQGELVAIINYCTQLVLTLIVFTNIIMIYSRGAVSMKRVQEVLDHETTILDQGTQTVAKGAIALTFEHVNFSYGNQKRHVLKDISFSLQKGEVLGIIGLTGSGKSSLVSLIPRLYDVKSGQILINEQPIQTYVLENLREHIGYVAQKPEFLEGSLARNVLMLQTGNAGVYLDDAQGADIVAKGLTTPIYEGGTNLSGGQRQRINIARALAKQPGLLIFDDSFSALDPLTEKHLQATINDKYQGVTQILISQKTTTLQHADKIMVLDEGKMVALDTHAGLLKKNTMYREIHELQTGRAGDDTTFMEL